MLGYRASATSSEGGPFAAPVDVAHKALVVSASRDWAVDVREDMRRVVVDDIGRIVPSRKCKRTGWRCMSDEGRTRDWVGTVEGADRGVDPIGCYNTGQPIM